MNRDTRTLYIEIVREREHINRAHTIIINSFYFDMSGMLYQVIYCHTWTFNPKQGSSKIIFWPIKHMKYTESWCVTLSSENKQFDYFIEYENNHCYELKLHSQYQR